MRRIQAARIFSRAENEKVFDPVRRPIYALSIIITRGIIFSAGNQSRQQEEGWRQGAGSFKRHKFACPSTKGKGARELHQQPAPRTARIHFCVRLQPHNEIGQRWALLFLSKSLARTRWMQNMTHGVLPSWFCTGPKSLLLAFLRQWCVYAFTPRWDKLDSGAFLQFNVEMEWQENAEHDHFLWFALT